MFSEDLSKHIKNMKQLSNCHAVDMESHNMWCNMVTSEQTREEGLEREGTTEEREARFTQIML